MGEKKARLKKGLMIVAVLFVLSAIAVGIFLLSRSKKNVYQNDYYSIELPEGWTYELREPQWMYFMSPDGTKAGYIHVWPNFENFGQGVYSLVRRAEIMGNHGSIKASKIVMTNDRQIPFYRVVMERELSPAETWQGKEPRPDELYFLYIGDDDLFICVEVLDNTLWDEVEEIVKTMRLISK